MHFPNWLMSGLLVVVLCATAGAGTGEPQADVIAQLIQQLGSDGFSLREQASHELRQIGLPAQTPLTAALHHRDPEIRRRARSILVQIRQDDYDRRLAAFEADTEGRQDHGLPCWDAYRQDVGHDDSSRELFAQMQRAEAALLMAAEQGGDPAAQLLEHRSAQLEQQALHRAGGSADSLSLGSVAALYFVAADSKVALTQTVANRLSNFCYQQAFQQALSGGEFNEPVRKLLGRWVARSEVPTMAYHAFLLAMRYDLREALTPAIEMLRDQGGHAHMRQYALLVVGRFGSREHLALLQRQLSDTAVCMNATVNNQRVQVEVRDVALAVLIHLTDQNLSAYGLGAARTDSKMLYHTHTLGFSDDDEREKAQRKWQAWAAEHLPAPRNTREPS